MKNNIYMQIIKENGKFLKPVVRNTEDGRSRYANGAYRKYGEQVTVEEYKIDYVDGDLKIINLCTWHA